MSSITSRCSLARSRRRAPAPPFGWSTAAPSPELLLDQREPQHVRGRQPAPGQVQHGAAAAHGARRIRLSAVRFQQFRPLRRLPTNTLDILAPNYTQNIAVPTAIFQNLDQHLQQRGLYVQDEAKLGRLTVLGGVRYDWAEGNTLAQNTGLRVLNDDQKPTGRIGAIYNFDNGVAPYVSYSTSFQPTSVGTLLNGQPFKPTTGEQYEGGVKYQPIGNNLMFTAAVYDLKQQNVTTTITGPGIPRQHHSPGRRGHFARLRGIGGRKPPARPEPARAVFLSRQPDHRRPGRQFRQAARQHADAHGLAVGQLCLAKWACHRLWLRWRRPLCPRHVHDRRQQPDRSHHRARRLLPASVVPASTVFDAALSYDFGMRYKEWKGLSAALNVNNVFDRTYVSLCTGGGCRWALGRTVLGTLTYRW